MLTREQIVAVAKDVIAQIQLQKLIIQCGTYLDAEEEENGGLIRGATGEFIKDLQELLQGGKKCVVCARGALILSKANLFNNCPVGKDERPYQTVIDLSEADFPADIWASAEMAFEGIDNVPYETLVNVNNQTSCQEFYEAYEDDSTERLIAIMNNIIRNKGYFHPKENL